MIPKALVLCVALAALTSASKLWADADLALKFSVVTPAAWAVGSSNTFVLTVTNQGPDTASQVLLTNQLDSIFTLAGVVPSQGSWSNNGAVVYCDLGDLTNQQVATVNITVVPNSARTATNFAGAFAAIGDPVPANNVVQNTLFIRNPFVRINNTSVVEGNSGLTNAVFTVWLDYPSPQTVSMGYQTASQGIGSAATAGTDYIATNGTLIFPPGVTTQMVYVAVVGDLVFETDPKIGGESFNVNLINPTNASFADQRGVGVCVIVDDDPPPSLTVGDVSVVEGQSGTKVASFPITLSTPIGYAVTAHFATANGTATSGSDYTATSGTVSIAAGQTNATVNVTIIGDTLMEGDETFALILSSPQNATLARAQGVCTILSDELALSLSPAVQENAGLLPAAGQVSIGGPLAADLEVTLSNSRPDMITLPASVVIPVGATNAFFGLSIVNDNLLNGSRTATVTASAYQHADASANVVVHDDETTTLTLDLPALVQEGSGSCTGRVFVAAATGQDVSVSLASSDTNRVQLPAFVTIPAGGTSASFIANLPNDFQVDPSELVTVTAHVQNWTDGVATITVADLTNIVLTIPTLLAEGQWATGLVQVTVIPATNMTITLSVSDNTTLAVPSSVQVPAGQTSVTFPFQAVDDAVYRGTQSVTLTAQADGLSSAMNVVTVLENDPHHFTLSRVPALQVAYNGSPGSQPPSYNVTLTACDESGSPLPAFNRSATLSAAGQGGSVNVQPPTTSAFSNGVCVQSYYCQSWDNNVRLTVSDGQGHTGQSNPFNIRAPSAYFLPIAANDLAWDAVRQRICVSGNNQLAFINPVSGKVESTLLVGQGTGRLAISDDSHYLYIAMRATNVVRRLDLSTGLIDLEFWLGASIYAGGQYYGYYSLLDMAVMPGYPDVVAVTRGDYNLDGTPNNAEGVALYVGGILRSNVFAPPPAFGPHYIEFGGYPPTRLYGYDTRFTHTFFRMYVTSDGIVGDTTGSYMQQSGLDFRYSDGRIYVSNGQVFNPEGSSQIMAQLVGAVQIPAPELGKVLSVRLPDLLRIYDEPTLVSQADVPIPYCSGTASSGIRWGDAGIAFRVTGDHFLVCIMRPDSLADLNANGLPDAWERQHFGATGVDPNADADGDGMSNYAEYLAGTDPLNRTDVLCIHSVHSDASSALVTFPTVVGRSYRLERASSLAAGDWTVVDEVAGSGQDMTLTDSAAASQSSAFYRIKAFF